MYTDEMYDEPQKRVLLYARVSSEDQAKEEHFSIDAQIHEMEEEAKKRNWIIVETFVDAGVSGTTEDRPQFQAALAVVRNRGCDIFMVHDLSRLARSVYITLDTLDIFGKYNVGFLSVKDRKFDFTDPTSRLLLNILASINQYYVDQLRMHTSKAKRQRIRRGLYNFSIAPYGYQMSGSPLEPPVIDPHESKAVQMAYEAYASGSYSDTEIGQMLADAGFLTRPTKKFPQGGGFSKDMIASMLRNPFYKGLVVHRPTQNEVEGKHETLIPETLWDKVQQVRSNRKGASRAVQKAYRVYMLSNLARCDVCGRTLRAQATPNDIRYYREMSKDRGYNDCPHQNIGTRSEPVEQQMDAIISLMNLPETWLKEAEELLGTDDDLIVLQKRRERLEAEYNRLVFLYVRGEFGNDYQLYRQEKERIERELSKTPTLEQLNVLRETAETIQDLPSIWAQADPGDKRDLLRLMVKKVCIDVIQGRVTAIQPLPAFIPVFRQVSMLQERDFGLFVPIWPLDFIREDEKKQNSIFTTPSLDLVDNYNDPVAFAPFLTSNFLAPETTSRITPGISQALHLFKKASREPEIVRQIQHPALSNLPMDLRKWPRANSDTITLENLENQPPDSIQILISQLIFAQQFNHDDFEWEPLIEKVYTALAPGGVWYLQDSLPLEMPAHWVFRVFPETWGWCHQMSLSLHRFYNALQFFGFKDLTAKRHVRRQPINTQIALQIAKKGAPLFEKITTQEIEQGILSLSQSSKPVLPSEVMMVEIWAQKPR